jgi:hypothetical protein
MAKESIEKGIKHDRDLEVSYGGHVPQPSTVKGDIVAFGILAGSTETAKPLVPTREITFDGSIVDNRKNQPKSH